MNGDHSPRMFIVGLVIGISVPGLAKASARRRGISASIRPVEQRLLAVYLNDHLAGSVLGSELARRVARENRGSPLGEFLEHLLKEILDDKRTLERVLQATGVRPSPIKPRVAWALEKLGRLKLNGRIRRYSPLSRLLELEGLEMGIRGKRALWQALGEVDDSRLSDFDFAALRQRAEDQLEGVESHRLEAAKLVADTASR